MGYACPVCDTPQRDGEHLAHHLAFTAMLHGGDHESWLDERVDDWSEREPTALAAEVTPHAEDAEYDEVFEDTVPRGRPDVGMGSGGEAASSDHGHDHGRGSAHDHGADPDPAPDAGVPDPDAVDDPTVAEALREARELTREGAADDGDAGAEDEADDADAPDS
ncbi:MULTISPECIES: DUF5810 domain-containing protein [Halorubrum]|uniref:Uncharacterized protein n=1 Tax=Halorubrum sodomense TaxID=35743 RepID=A0A1I6FKY9_HALSD|nr:MULTISPECIES: DUF5810 domain-containing protein [Halorubrum]TKX56178.1 hypothetical protein EXE42_01055 [Halorubrum sp. SP3]SFR30609.1 hypothetical protein SAMN04487937_0435 [Halorubrum sodomense]